MRLIKCPECHEEISAKATLCHHCGVPISTSFKAKPKMTKTPPAPLSPLAKFGFVALILLFLAYVLFGLDKIFQPTEENAAIESKDGKKRPKADVNPNIMVFEPILVGLSDDGKKRSALINMWVEMAAWGDIGEIRSKMPPITDAVRLLISSKTVDELDTPEEKALLKKELIAKINSMLKGNTVKNLVFVGFTIQ
jgi:flagellar FliL protein